MTEKIQKIENYVKSLPEDRKPAHGYDHVSRVRNWAIKIARAENFPDLEMVEAAALLHDIGRTIPQEQGKTHGELSARLAEKFLNKNKLFGQLEITQICEAVAHHSDIKEIKSNLLDILRDADILDLLGPIGILRVAMAEHHLKIFNEENIKGETWGMTNVDFNRDYAGKIGKWATLPDQYNFQMSCFYNLKTDYAKKIAEPMAQFMKNFVLEVEKQANNCLER